MFCALQTSNLISSLKERKKIKYPDFENNLDSKNNAWEFNRFANTCEHTTNS